MAPRRWRGALLGGLAAAAAWSACGDRIAERCVVAYEAGSFEEAARLCEVAWRKSGDPRAGVTKARALVRLGQSDQALAWIETLQGSRAEPGSWSVAAAVWAQRGESERAARAFRTDLGLLTAPGDSAAVARAHYGLFYLAWERSRYRDALEQARLSFAAAGVAADRGSQALAAEALYTVLYSLGDLAGAQRALSLTARLLPPERTADRARLLANQGILALDEGRPELARHEIEQAIVLMDGRGDRRFYRSAYINLVQADLDGGDLGSAGRHLTAAWRHAEPAGLPETALLYYRARLQRARQRPIDAAQSLAEALAGDPVPDWAWDLEHERGRVAEERGDLRTAEQAYERSAAFVEEMRRAIGFDELKAWLLDRKREPFESLFLLRARAGRATEALATVERAKVRSFQDAFLQATAQAPAAPRDVWTAAAERADFLRDLLPAMSESVAVALVPVERSLAALRGQRVLVYFEARNELWLLDVTGGRVYPRRLDATTGRVDALVDRLLATPDEPALAGTLGALLLPADLRLSPGSTLYIVPDGSLSRLPFAALRRGDRWLVEDHAVVYGPGVSALAAPGARDRAAAAPVVLADPRGDLPQSAAEGREVAALLGSAPRLGPAATARALMAGAGAAVLHVAGHAGWGPGGPWLEMADRNVTPAMILKAKVRPRLVVLASCASAFPAGRGLWGSPGAAFLAAGSEAVLASLGSVEDRTTRELVLRFYREGGAADPAGGLARAQRAFLTAGRPPSAWAPFVLLGRHPF